MNLRKLAGAGCSLVVTLGLACAAQEMTVKHVPLKCVDASSGKSMYVNYCAACHGMTGQGNGPAAKALKTVPSDLSLLAAHNKGNFPAYHVLSVIRGGDAMLPAAHGAKDMPLWESLFKGSCGAGDAEVRQRVYNLTKYVESLQKG